MEAALDASRRVNSFGTGVRILEGLREKVRANHVPLTICATASTFVWQGALVVRIHSPMYP